MNKQRRRTHRQGNSVARHCTARSRRNTARPLFAERLEDRRLLAVLADGTYHNSYHNVHTAEDVTGDRVISPRDALVVISELNAGGSRSLSVGPEADAASVAIGKIDVSGDNALSPRDALLVIRALNDGEGVGELMSYGVQVLDANGNALPNNRVKAGDEFQVLITVQDLRPNGTGVYSAYVDVGYSNDINDAFELFTLGGNDPSEFPNDTPPGSPRLYSPLFDSFWTRGEEYGNGLPTACPWRFGTAPNWVSCDGDMVADEFDEVGGFWTNLSGNLGNRVVTLAYVQLTAELPSDSDKAGTVTFQSNMGQGDVLFFNDVSHPPTEDDILFGSSFVTIYRPVYAIDDPEETTDEDMPVTIDVLANDVLDSSTTGPLSLVADGYSQPAHGTLQIVNGRFVYTPAANFNGTDSFTYTARDASGNTDTATVSITVNEVNDDPIAVIDTVAVDEDSGAHVINVLANDLPGGGADEAGQELIITAITQPAHGVAVIVPGNLQVQYTPAADYFGSDSFTYTISDGAGGTATGTVSITVNNVNDPPTANDNIFNNVQEDATTALDVLANDSILPDVGETLTITAVNKTDGTGAGQTNQGGTVAVVAGKVNYTPPANFFGQDSFQYTISDGGLTDTATVIVNVVNVNDGPIAVNDILSADERLDAADPGTELLVLANDKAGPDNEVSDTIRIVAVSTPDKLGTVEIINNGQSLLFTPKTGAEGFYDETFTYTIRDSGGLESTATVTVTVEPVVRPRARNDQATVAEDGQVSIPVLTNDVFNDGAQRTLFEIVAGQGPSHGTVIINGDIIVYQPAADYFGTDSFQYVIDDNFEGSVPSTATVTVTVTSVNDAPIAVDDNQNLATILEDQASTLLVLGNDKAGPANETEAIFVQAVVSGPSHGTIVKSADEKSFIYTPNAHYFGLDTFTYTIRDAFGAVSEPATVVLVVENVNDAPIAVNDSATVDEDSVDNIIDVLADDSVGPANEADVDSISLKSVGIPSQGGTAVMDAVNQVIKYTPAADFFGTETFTYTIVDEGGLEATATVTVTVNDVNDAPLAADDSLMALKNFENQVLDVIVNDSVFPDRPEDETLTIKGLLDANDQVVNSIKTPHGTATVSGDRLTIIYTPDTDFETVGNDLDTFEYVVQDGRGGEDIGAVEVDVIDAVPSDLSGVIYIDANGDGIQQSHELTLGGIDVTLTGTNIRGTAVDLTVKTDAHGVFTFAGILPNAEGDTVGYSIAARTPKYLNDGRETIIDMLADENYTPGQAGNDVFAGINLGVWGTDRSASNYSFGEAGLSSKYIKLSQYLASTRKGIMLGTDGDGETYWFAVQQGWEGVESISFDFANHMTPEGMATAMLTVVGTNGQTYQKSLSYFRDYDFAGDPRVDGCVVFLKGSAADFGFDLAAHDGEGEAMSEGDTIEMLAAADSGRYAEGVDAVFGAGDWA